MNFPRLSCGLIAALALVLTAWPLVGMEEPFVSKGDFLSPDGQSGSQTQSQTVYGYDQYLVVWQEVPRQEQILTEIRAARLDRNGRNLDPNGFRISTRPGSFSNICMLFDGLRYYLVWIEYPHGGQASEPGVLYGARIDLYGKVLDPGGRVLDASPLKKATPDLAVGAGTGLLVWQQDDNKIVGRLVDTPSGDFAAPPIVLFDGNHGLFPRVAFTGGVFLVIWERRSGVMETEGLYARRVDTTGKILDPEPIRFSHQLGDGRNASLAADRHGFLAIWENGWESTDNGEKGIGLQGARIAIDGRKTDLDGWTITGGSLFKTVADAAFDGLNYVVAWWEVEPFSDTAQRPFPPSPFIVPEKKELRAGRVSPGGRVLDGHGFTIRPENEPIVFRVDRESLACDGESRCLVTYTDFDHRLHVKKFRISRRLIDLRNR